MERGAHVIIMRLLGGLGNQMFQHATGRRLASHLGTKLKLDVSGFEAYKLRSYSLDAFHLKADFATKADVVRLKFGKTALMKWRVLGKKEQDLRPMPSYIQEKHFRFDPAMLNLPDGVYLDGYWQSEKYFADISDAIRADFAPQNPMSAPSIRISEKIKSFNSVALHVRRGDYVSNPNTNKVHGSLGVDYYERSMEAMVSKLPKPHFFVFSDDPTWARTHFGDTGSVTIVDVNDEAHAHEDMRLMSLCAHHIIANSSFSWWGAWLAENLDKIVIAPQKWFQDPVLETKDLIPESWLRL